MRFSSFKTWVNIRVICISSHWKVLFLCSVAKARKWVRHEVLILDDVWMRSSKLALIKQRSSVVSARGAQNGRWLHVLETQQTRAQIQRHVRMRIFWIRNSLINKYFRSTFHYRSCQRAVRDSKLTILFSRKRGRWDHILRSIISTQSLRMSYHDYQGRCSGLRPLNPVLM